MRIAVTGAAGLTGGAIAELLAQEGHTVRPIARRHLPSLASAAIADCRDPDATARAIDGCDLLIHGAGIALGPSIAEAIRRAGTPRLLAISTAAVRSRHRAAVGDYLRGEEALRAVRPDAVLVRPTMIYGSDRDRNIHHVIAFARRFRFLPIIGGGSALVQPIHFEDLARAVVLLIRRPNAGTVEAGGGSPLTIREAAAAVLRAIGGPSMLVPVPVGIARSFARVVERARGGRIVERVERMLEDRSVDNTRLRELTGLDPREFDDGVMGQVLASR